MLENNLPIDTKYYLENQLSKPLLRIFEPIMGESKAQSLLSGDHTRVIQVAAPTQGGLMKFAKKTATCLGCKVPLSKGGNSIYSMYNTSFKLQRIGCLPALSPQNARIVRKASGPAKSA